MSRNGTHASRQPAKRKAGESGKESVYDMRNRAERVRLGPPIDLGQAVRARIGQAAVFGTRRDGTHELYVAVNGTPAMFCAVELATGHIAFRFSIPHTDSVWAMAAAPDGTVYFAGMEDGALYRYLPEERRLETVGRHPADPWVWDLKPSPDGRLYGATYPNAKIFEYHPEERRFRDLGRMSADQQYARGIGATNRDVFAGIGSTIRLMRWDRTNGETSELHLEGYSGKQGFVDRIWPAESGDVLFVSIGQSEMLVYDCGKQRILDRFACSDFISPASPVNGEYYFVAGGSLYAYRLDTLTSTLQTDIPVYADHPSIKCMQWLAERDGTHTLAIVSSSLDVVLFRPDDRSIREVRTDLPTVPVQIQSLEWDGNEKLYMGGYHRGLSIYNAVTGEIELSIPKFPQTEGIGFLDGKVYFGTYTRAKIFGYDPELPADTRLAASSNPAFLFAIGHGQDRPFAIASGDGKLFIGTIPDYGLLTGALTVYDPQTGKHEVYTDIVPNQSIIGLTYRNGLLYGGTSNWGGLGIEPSETEAKLFVWDVQERRTLHVFTPDIPDIDIPPRMIGELTFGPDGLLWGAVDGTIFAMSPETLRVVKSKVICPSEYKYSRFRPYFLRWGPSGLLFTSLARKLIAVDPQTLDHAILDEEPLALMTLGPDGNLYYNDVSHLMMREVRILDERG